MNIVENWLPETTTAQELYDHVVNHLRTMKSQSIGPDGDCLYHQYDLAGKIINACAVGCLIPEKEYDLGNYLGGVTYLFSEYEDIIPRYLDTNIDVLVALQEVHDNPENWYEHDRGFNKYGEYMLEEIAQKFGLTYTPKADNL